jgi:membrane-bound lytic murein transglycosylase D
MIISRHNTPWLPLLAITAIAMFGQTASMNHGNGIDSLFNTFLSSAGKTHHGTYPPVIPTAELRPDRLTPAGGPSGNLWTGLRNGFALPAGNHAAVQAQLDRFARDPANVERIMQRGKPWLHHILHEVRQRGLPTELALLPVIESAFNLYARSPRHAAGLWQFMPATARELGLQQNDWYDGRRDVIAATAAALDYLEQLQQRFDGDWLLALAAYNAGAARVQRAIRKNRNSGKPVDFWQLQLPEETRNYVPKLLALRSLIETPEAFGLKLPTVPDAPWFTVVDAGGPLDFGVAARLADIPVEEISRLNPAYTRQTIHRNGPHTLVIPGTQATAFRTRLAGLSEEQRVPWVRHRIRYGDTLSTIARHYRIPVVRLREFNRLPDSRIVAGDLLIVPDARG